MRPSMTNHKLIADSHRRGIHSLAIVKKKTKPNSSTLRIVWRTRNCRIHGNGHLPLHHQAKDDLSAPKSSYLTHSEAHAHTSLSQVKLHQTVVQHSVETKPLRCNRGVEMQQKADHTRTCLIMKYSAAAREFAKTVSSTWSCGTGASKNSNGYTSTPKREWWKNKGKLSNLDRLTEALPLQRQVRIVLNNNKVSRSIAISCVGAASQAWTLKLILGCTEKIASQCSQLEGVARARTARSGTVQVVAAVRVRDWD